MTRTLLALTLFVGGLLAPFGAKAGEVVRHAVVVGANHGGSLLETLTYAETDAAKMADLLIDIGGFEPENVIVLLGPTVSDVAVTLYNAAEDSAAEGSFDDDQALFLFYYSGHADEIGLRINGGLLPYAELKEAIRMVPAEVHLGILDACRSGAITTLKGASVATPFLQTEDLEAEGEAWLAAASADEDAQESDLLEGSFFTYYLLSGLRGAADSGDGYVSLYEAYSYARDRTEARTSGTQGGTQHPAYDFRIQGNGELKLTDVGLATARITLPAEIAGEIAILRMPERMPVAEVAKPDGRPMTLALEPATYLLRRRVDQGVQEVTISLSPDSELVVDRWGDMVAEVATLKGSVDIDGDGVADAVAANAAEETTPGDDDDGVADAEHPHSGPVIIRVPVKYSDQPWEISIPKVNWESMGDSPAIAGTLSIVPGLGHFYDKRWGRGAFFMASTMGLYSVGFGVAPAGVTKSLTGPNPITFMAIAMHIWAIADAAWGVHRSESFMARKGLTLSLETGWATQPGPYVSGFAIDIYPTKGLSVGLDRTGVTVTQDDVTFTFGTRMTAGPSWKRFRMAGLVALGSRVGVPREELPDSQGEEASIDHVDVAFVIGTGALMQLYLTPRYYLQTEFRGEWVDGSFAPVFGLGMGFRIGR